MTFPPDRVTPVPATDVGVMRSIPEAVPLPATVQVSDAVRTRVALEYWATVSVPVMVTPAPAVSVTTPAPRLRRRRTVYASHTTEACGGTA